MDIIGKKISCIFNKNCVVEEGLLCRDGTLFFLFSNCPRLEDGRFAGQAKRHGYKYAWCFGLYSRDYDSNEEMALKRVRDDGFSNFKILRKLNHEE